MKKSFQRIMTILPAFLLFSLLSGAQKTSFGIKAGVNLATLDTDDGINFQTKVGIHAGALAHIHLSKNFAIQPELVYSCQGGEYLDNKVKLGYVNLPVLVQYMVGNGFRLQTGPQLGVLVSAKQKLANGTEIDVDNIYDNVDFSWALGAGYLFSGGFGVDARYNWGFTDIADASTVDYSNRVFQIGLFYQFKKKTVKK